MFSPSIYEKSLKENIVTTKDGDYVSILEWIEQNIRESPNKRFKIDVKEMKMLLGPDFKKKSDDTIISTVKKILLKYGISTKSKTYDKGDRIATRLTMSFDPINMSYEDALTKNKIYTEDGKELSILNYIEQKTTNGRFVINVKKIRELLGPGFEGRDIYSMRIMLRNIFNRHDIKLTSISNRKGDINLYFYRKNNNTSEI